MVLHVHSACRILADDRLGALTPELKQTINNLHESVLAPVFRSYPDLQRTSLPSKGKLFRATIRDIDRTTAVKLRSELTQIGRRVADIASKAIDTDNSLTRRGALAKTQLVTDALAELGFAEKIAYDAYPELWKRAFAEIPAQPRSSESDANLRKAVPPLGSVKLSDAALAFVRGFMRQVRTTAPAVDHVAAITWTMDESSKSPEDTEWKHRGAGLTLGAYTTKQVPPDVVDTVRGVKIIFSAENPSIFVGKTVDYQDGRFFIHD